MEKESILGEIREILGFQVVDELELRFVRGEPLTAISKGLELERDQILKYLRAREAEARKFCEDLGIAEQVPNLRSGLQERKIRGRKRRLGTFVTMSLIWKLRNDRFLSTKEIARQLGMSYRVVQRRLAILHGKNRFHGGLTTHVRPRNSTEAWVLRLLEQCRCVQEYYGCLQVGPDFLALHDHFGWILIECKKSSSGIPYAIIELLLGTQSLKKRTGHIADKRVILYEDISRTPDPRVASNSVAQIINNELGIEVYRIAKDFCPFRTCPDWKGCGPISNSSSDRPSG